MGKKKREKLEMELLFNRVVNRVIWELVPVVFEELDGVGARCKREVIILNPKYGLPYRLWAPLHECAHYVMHVGPGHDDHSPEYVRTWEFEANQVATILHIRLGLPPYRFTDRRYHTDDIVSMHPMEYYQQRIDEAVERIWKIVGE